MLANSLTKKTSFLQFQNSPQNNLEAQISATKLTIPSLKSTAENYKTQFSMSREEKLKFQVIL